MQDAEAVRGRHGAVLRLGAGREFGADRTGHVIAGQKPADDASPGGVIEVRLRAFLIARNMTLAELSHQVGVSTVNLSVLKNGHARAIRFSTLARLCEALDCQPGDLLVWCANRNGDREGPLAAEPSAAEPSAAEASAAEAEAPRGGAEAR